MYADKQTQLFTQKLQLLNNNLTANGRTLIKTVISHQLLSTFGSLNLTAKLITTFVNQRSRFNLRAGLAKKNIGSHALNTRV